MIDGISKIISEFNNNKATVINNTIPRKFPN